MKIIVDLNPIQEALFNAGESFSVFPDDNVEIVTDNTHTSYELMSDVKALVDAAPYRKQMGGV